MKSLDDIAYERDEEAAVADELASVVRRFFPFGDDGSFEVERALARYQARCALR